MPTTPGPGLAVALVLLLSLALLASAIGQLGRGRAIGIAALRAVLQLAAISLVITAVLGRLLWSALFGVFMLLVASATSAGRIGARAGWPWTALAITVGVAPTLAIVFASRAVPFTGAALVPVAGIIIGGGMTAVSLTGRRAFAALRDEFGCYEAGLSLGLPRSSAVIEVIGRHLPEALVPGLDQTRTVGLVTLPGAFVGVLLGGGTPVQAGAAQVLVLVALLATQTITVVTISWLVRSARLLPPDLRERLHP